MSSGRTGTTLRVPWDGRRQLLILEPRFVVSVIAADSVRITSDGSVVLTLEEAARVVDALGRALLIGPNTEGVRSSLSTEKTARSSGDGER